jgi:hypothetical protein
LEGFGMKNLINWMCLISIMVLVLQVMIHINSEVINDVNKINRKRRRVTRNAESIEKTGFEYGVNCYQEKIAK